MKRLHFYHIALWLGFLGTLWGSSARAADDTYQFDWLDPDKKIYVLQNRLNEKRNHLFIEAMGGFGFSNAFRSSYNIDGRVSFFFHEMFGVEGFAMYSFHRPNNNQDAIEASSPTRLPSVRELLGRYGAHFVVSPFYGKFNFFNAIVYYDWHVHAGLAYVQSRVDMNEIAGNAPNYVGQNLVAGSVGTGQRFYIKKRFVIRWDLTTFIYRAPILGVTGTKATYSDVNLNIGFGVKI